jgi:arylsulfatase A-like enzyme
MIQTSLLRPLSLVLAVTALSCTGGEGPAAVAGCNALRETERPEAVNVILIVGDTVRRDHVGIYGGKARTPAFDRFASENFYFDQAFANAPWTKPSVASLFTSTYPSQHRLASHPELRGRLGRDGSDRLLGETDVLSDGYTTLAELFRDAGYSTAAFVSNPWMSREFGFAQGFELYDDSFAGWDADGETLSRGALGWLEALPSDERFFLYLHYIDSHRPYGTLGDDDVSGDLRPLARGLPPRSQSARDLFDWLVAHEQQELSERAIRQLGWLGPSIAFLEMAYARGVEEFDRALGLFLTEFAEHPEFGRTAILVTSDHGEALYSRGYGSHGIGLFDDEIAIPLAASMPGVEVSNPRVECSVELIDVMPSLCAYAGLPCPDHVFGRSFLGGGGARFNVGEGVMLKPRNRSIRNRDHKLIWEPDGPSQEGIERDGDYALFDIVADPGETRDLLAPDRRTPETQRIADALAALLPESIPSFDAPDAEFAPVDPEVEERLRALGYLD